MQVRQLLTEGEWWFTTADADEEPGQIHFLQDGLCQKGRQNCPTFKLRLSRANISVYSLLS